NSVTEILGALLGFLNLLMLEKTQDLKRSASVLLLLMVLILSFLLLSGGIAGTGVYWFFTFPALAFFLKGKRGGIVWNGVVVLVLVLGGFLDYFKILPLPYSYLIVRQLLASFLAVCFLIYFFQKINEDSLTLLKQSSEKLMVINQDLHGQMLERQK